MKCMRRFVIITQVRLYVSEGLPDLVAELTDVVDAVHIDVTVVGYTTGEQFPAEDEHVYILKFSVNCSSIVKTCQWQTTVDLIPTN